MKAVISFALVIAMVVPLTAFAALQEKASSAAAQADYRVLLLEKRHYAEMELKESLKQVLESARGSSREERVADVAFKLAEWEWFEEKEFASRGISLDLWCGVATEQEISLLKNKVLEARHAVKPFFAHDFSELVVGWRGELVPAAMAFLESDALGKARISRNGFSLVPEIAQVYGAAGGRVFFGASLYFREGVAAVALAGEDFE
ncbi:MAG: hypothetical protein ACP5IG_02075 [Candidatus Micrarchaeia archaeon]